MSTSHQFALYSLQSLSFASGLAEDDEAQEAEFRLTLVHHRVQSGELEAELRLFITRRLAKGMAFDGSGSVTVFDAKSSTMCYYCWLRLEETTASTESTRKISVKDVKPDGFVVCFLSSTDDSLDLFCSELDTYCGRLRHLFLTERGNALSEGTKQLLSSWYDSNVLYVCRCVGKLRDRLPSVIYASLMGIPVDISGGSRRDEDDITRFVDNCSVSALLQDKHEVNVDGLVSPATSLLVDVTGQEASNSPKRLTITVSESAFEVSSNETNKFCEDWTARMLGEEEESKPSYLRQVLENFKLKVIQDLNTLKRLMKQAEMDHYALYRSFAFLRDCGNASPLLRLGRQESQAPSAVDARAILELLYEHMQTEGIIL